MARHRQRDVLRGQLELAALACKGEGGTGFDAELVRGDVLGREARDLCEVAFEVPRALPRGGVDEVEGEGGEAGVSAGREGAVGLGGAVGATEALQHGILERLHAHRDPGDPGGTEIRQATALEGARVHLERDLDRCLG